MPKPATNDTAVIKMEFQHFPARYYQRYRQKHSSGDAYWHSRSAHSRKQQRIISQYTPLGWKNWQHFLRTLAAHLGSEGA